MPVVKQTAGWQGFTGDDDNGQQQQGRRRRDIDTVDADRRYSWPYRVRVGGWWGRMVNRYDVFAIIASAVVLAVLLLR